MADPHWKLGLAALAGAPALALLAWPETGSAQAVACPNIDPRFSSPGTCTSQAQSITERIVFTTPSVTVRRIDTFATQIVGRLQGGTLFDQTYPVPFADPQAQSGVSAAMMAITNAGGPGVVIAAPVRTERSETLLASTSTSQFTLNRSELSLILEEQIGTTPAPTVPILGFSGSGSDGPCTQAIAALPSATRPVCGPDTREAFPVPTNTVHLTVRTDIVHFVDEAREQTDTWRTFERWEIEGTVVAIGTIHAAVQSSLFDQSGRLLQRLPELRAGGWAEAYATRMRHGDRRDTAGLAGGFALPVAPGLIVGLGADQGWTDIDVPGALETGKVELTELGATAHYADGPVSAALSATIGFGEADTARTIVGDSRAAYGVETRGIALDLGYGLETGGWRLQALAGAEYVRVESDGFAETGTLGLTAADHEAERLRASAGLEVGRDLVGVELVAMAHYVAVLDGGERELPVAFAIAPGTELLMTGPAEGDGGEVGARARIPLAAGASLTFGYDGRFGRGYTYHQGFAALSFRW